MSRKAPSVMRNRQRIDALVAYVVENGDEDGDVTTIDAQAFLVTTYGIRERSARTIIQHAVEDCKRLERWQSGFGAGFTNWLRPTEAALVLPPPSILSTIAPSLEAEGAEAVREEDYVEYQCDEDDLEALDVPDAPDAPDAPEIVLNGARSRARAARSVALVVTAEAGTFIFDNTIEDLNRIEAWLRAECPDDAAISEVRAFRRLIRRRRAQLF